MRNNTCKCDCGARFYFKDMDKHNCDAWKQERTKRLEEERKFDLEERQIRAIEKIANKETVINNNVYASGNPGLSFILGAALGRII